MSLKGAWTMGENGSLLHSDTAGPASISFSARDAAILVRCTGSCGDVSVSNTEGQIWEHSFPRLKDIKASSFAAVDLPAPVRPSMWAFAVWLIIALAVLLAVKPWTGDHRVELWLLVYLLALNFLFWSTQCVGFYSDGLGQMQNLKLNALGFSVYYPPGYPLLVGLGYLLSAQSAGLVITLLQHLMMIAVVWWCFRLLTRCVGTTPAFLAALLMGAAAADLAAPQAIISSNAALFGMVGGLYFAVRYRDAERPRDAIFSGLLIGWATLARIAPLIAMIPAVALVMLETKPLAMGARRFGLVCLVALLLTAIPMVWFGAKHGRFELTASFGHHMYDRILVDENLLNTKAPETSYFLKLIAPINPRGMPQLKMHEILAAKGFSWYQIDALMERVAMESISHAPLQYIKFSFEHAWWMYLDEATNGIPWWSDYPKVYSKSMESAPLLGVRANSLLWRAMLDRQFAMMWIYVPWLALAGILLLPALLDRMVFLSFAVIPCTYLVLTAFVASPLPRYDAAIVPFIIGLAAGPFAAVPKLIGDRRERGPTQS